MTLAELLNAFRDEVKAKFSTKRFSVEAFAVLLGVDPERFRKWERGAKPNSDEDRAAIKGFFEMENLEDIPDSALSVGLSKIAFTGKEYSRMDSPGPSKTTGDQLRQQKVLGRQQKGILAVPIKAQAGYARMLHDDYSVLIDQLERLVIPNFPYDGEDFRAFEVEGDSMEYVNEGGQIDGLPSGMWVVAQRVPQEDWRDNLSKYRVHVVVFARQIVIKRILQDNPDEIILHSDNPAFQQERRSLADVQEIWYVVRKMDWNMPPPRRIEIAV